MTIQVTGKNIDAGEAYKSYVAEKVPVVLGKYVGDAVTGHFRLEKERGLFRTACSIRLPSGLLLEAHGDGVDAYASADAAMEHLEKRVRRYKRRLKNHHNGRTANGRDEDIAADYVVRVEDDDSEGADADHPIIVAETERRISELPVSEAVMQLDLNQSSFMVFRNASHGGLNVVYRRADGNIGWIDSKSGDSGRRSIDGGGDSRRG